MAGTRLTAIEIVNEVQRKLGLNTTSTFTATKHATMLLQLLNEVITECGDYGDWQEYYEEVTVTAATSVNEYSVRSSGRNIHNILEVSFNGDASPLENRTITELRRLTRTSAAGNPRQYSVIGVDASGNPRFRTYPTPSSTYNGKLFDIAVYAKPNNLTTADTATTPVLPANVLIQGLYAKALLEENGGTPSREYQMAYQEYGRMLSEAQRRFTTDTENEVRFVPYRW